MTVARLCELGAGRSAAADGERWQRGGEDALLMAGRIVHVRPVSEADAEVLSALYCRPRHLVRGRDDWSRYHSLSSFALSAITRAGKTVIASAAIEAILHGSSDLHLEPDPRATFLWITDDPALKRQTRNKMLDASDLLAPARLIILDNDFLDSQLSTGRVYFLNVQKLSKNLGRE